MRQLLNSLDKRLKAVEDVHRSTPSIRVFIDDGAGGYTTTINGQQHHGSLDELEALLPTGTEDGLNINIMIPESGEDDE